MLMSRRGTEGHTRPRLGLYDNRQTVAALTLLLCTACPSLTTAAHADGDVIAQARVDVGRSNFTTEDITTPLTMVWKTTTTAIPKSTQAPLYQNGVIYFAMGKNVYALRSADGTTLWTYSGNATFTAPPAMSSDAL